MVWLGCLCADAETVEWENFATVMQALLATLHGFSTFMQVRKEAPSALGYLAGTAPGMAGSYCTLGQLLHTGAATAPWGSRQLLHPGAVGSYSTLGQRAATAPWGSGQLLHPGAAGSYCTLG